MKYQEDTSRLGFMTAQEEEFRSFVDSLFQSKRDGIEGHLHAAVGLSGESGEVLDHIKKSWVYDKDFDREKVLEEMSDTFHYFVMMMIKMGVTLGDVMRYNVEKLKKRYPNGFTKADAIARADKKPAQPLSHHLPHGHDFVG